MRKLSSRSHLRRTSEVPEKREDVRRYVFRYAMEDQPVPDGWEVRPLSGWNKAQGRVIWVRKDDERQE